MSSFLGNLIGVVLGQVLQTAGDGGNQNGLFQSLLSKFIKTKQKSSKNNEVKTPQQSLSYQNFW